MNGDEDRRDPVEEFFAAHRALVRDEPTDDLTWERIREQGRRGRSNRRGAWVAGLVAAAAALAVVLGPQLLPGTDEPDLAGPQPSVTDPDSGDHELPGEPLPTGEPTGGPDEPTSGPDEPTSGPDDPTGTDEPAGTDTATSEETMTTPVPPGVLPQDGRFTDVTTADPEPQTDTGVRYAVVMEECPVDGYCALLARSEDGGITWAPHADLRQLGHVHRLTFVDHSRGWVWGDKAPLWTTTDGGRTWTRVQVSADESVSAVSAVSVRGSELLAITVTRDDRTCGATTCSRGAVVLTSPTDTDWRDDVVHEMGAVETADVLETKTARYVVARESAVGPVTGLFRLQEGRLEATAALTGCDTGPVAITASTRDPDHLWALCDDEFGLALHETANGGRTWMPLNQTVPTFVLGERPPLLASVRADHLLLVGEGNFTVTLDGGRTWTDEQFLPGADSRPERLTTTLFGEVIALPTADPASGDLAYWRSGEDGAPWERVPAAH